MSSGTSQATLANQLAWHLAPLQLELLPLPPKGSEPASLEKNLEGKAEKISERLMSKVVSESKVVALLAGRCGMSIQ